MPEELESHPDTQKHFDALTIEVRRLARNIGRDRLNMGPLEWGKVFKKLPQKILKAENIKTVDNLKKFIEVKKRLSEGELQ